MVGLADCDTDCGGHFAKVANERALTPRDLLREPMNQWDEIAEKSKAPKDIERFGKNLNNKVDKALDKAVKDIEGEFKDREEGKRYSPNHSARDIEGVNKLYDAAFPKDGSEGASVKEIKKMAEEIRQEYKNKTEEVMQKLRDPKPESAPTPGVEQKDNPTLTTTAAPPRTMVV